MRPIYLVAPIAFALFLACSSGRSQPKTTPPPKKIDYTIRDTLLSLGKQKFQIRPSTSDTHFAFDFSKFARFKVVNIIHVGDDFVRIQNGDVRWTIPLSAISLIATD